MALKLSPQITSTGGDISCDSTVLTPDHIDQPSEFLRQDRGLWRSHLHHRALAAVRCRTTSNMAKPAVVDRLIERSLGSTMGMCRVRSACRASRASGRPTLSRPKIRATSSGYVTSQNERAPCDEKKKGSPSSGSSAPMAAQLAPTRRRP